LAVFLPLLFLIIDGLPVTLSKDYQIFCIMFGICILLFSILREMIKDLDDVVGDQAVKCNTMAVKYGEEVSRKWVFFILSLIVIAVFIWMFYASPTFIFALCLFSVIPLFKFVFMFLKSRDYKKQNKFIKAQMLLASLLIFVFKFL